MPINVYRKYKEVVGSSQGPSLIGTNRERYFEISAKKADPEEQREQQETQGEQGNQEQRKTQDDSGQPYNKKEDLLIRAKGCSLYVKDGVNEATLRTVLKVVREDA